MSIGAGGQQKDVAHPTIFLNYQTQVGRLLTYEAKPPSVSVVLLKPGASPQVSMDFSTLNSHYQSNYAKYNELRIRLFRVSVVLPMRIKVG